MTRYFTEEHEWIEVEGDTATVGITDHAQSQLGDIVFVEVPQPGTALTKGKEAAVVESVKAASDVYSPIGGTVTEGNTAIEDDPALVPLETLPGRDHYLLPRGEEPPWRWSIVSRPSGRPFG